MSNPDDADATQPQRHVPAPPPYQPMYPPAAASPTPPCTSARRASARGASAHDTAARLAAAHRRPPRRESRRRSLMALAVACFLAFAGITGYTIGANHDSSTTGATSNTVFPSQQLPDFSGNSSSSGNTSGNGRQSSIDVNAIAARVSPAIVNLTSNVDNGEAAGTGIVVSSSGLVLTNNHVIANSTDLQAEIGGDGEEHPAKVLGYNIVDDVALVQIEDVSGLTTASLGNSSSLEEGDAIVALGNAGGKGGAPSVVSGTVTALDQQITAADQDGSNAEVLDGLIQIDANIQPGDSGGPLVDAEGKVVGMDAAASSGNGNGGFGFGEQSGNEGYAIPIEQAMAIAKQIQSGDGSDLIHIGGHRALLGVAVQSSRATGGGFGGGFGNGQQSGSGEGAVVSGVQSGSAAESAGIEEGDTIVAIDDTTVTSGSQLTHTMVRYSPNDKVSVEWIDASSGQSQTATIELGSGTPA